MYRFDPNCDVVGWKPPPSAKLRGRRTQQQRSAEQQRAGVPQPPLAGEQQHPDGAQRQQEQGVLARERVGGERHAGRDEAASRLDPDQQPERQDQQEAGERRLLHQPFVVERRRVQREESAGEPAGARREQASADRSQEDARDRAQQHLESAQHADLGADQGVERPHQVGIERRLVEDLVADPVTGGDALGPDLVAATVPDQDRRQRSVGPLDQVERADRERTAEDRQVGPGAGLGRVVQERMSHAVGSRSQRDAAAPDPRLI